MLSDHHMYNQNHDDVEFLTRFRQCKRVEVGLRGWQWDKNLGIPIQPAIIKRCGGDRGSF